MRDSHKNISPPKSRISSSLQMYFFLQWLLGNGYPELGKWLVVIRILSIHHNSVCGFLRSHYGQEMVIQDLGNKLVEYKAPHKATRLMGYLEGYNKNSNKQVVKIKIGTTKSFDSDAMYLLSVLWQLTSSTEVSVVDFSKVKPHQHCKPLQISIFCTSLFSPKK